MITTSARFAARVVAASPGRYDRQQLDAARAATLMGPATASPRPRDPARPRPATPILPPGSAGQHPHGIQRPSVRPPDQHPQPSMLHAWPRSAARPPRSKALASRPGPKPRSQLRLRPHQDRPAAPTGDVGPCRRVPPHLGVHRRANDERPTAGQRQRGERIRASPCTRRASDPRSPARSPGSRRPPPCRRAPPRPHLARRAPGSIAPLRWPPQRVRITDCRRVPRGERRLNSTAAGVITTTTAAPSCRSERTSSQAL
jgi:hypothetical protein